MRHAIMRSCEHARRAPSANPAARAVATEVAVTVETMATEVVTAAVATAAAAMGPVATAAVATAAEVEGEVDYSYREPQRSGPR